MKIRYVSPSSSLPTPPSPLPVSVGPGHQRYFFYLSPFPSPSFSPPPSSHTSAENLPLVHHKPIPLTAPLVFSLDRPSRDELDSRSSCLKDLLEWLVLRCCSCCSWSLKIHPNPPPHTSSY